MKLLQRLRQVGNKPIFIILKDVEKWGYKCELNLDQNMNFVD